MTTQISLERQEEAHISTQGNETQPYHHFPIDDIPQSVQLPSNGSILHLVRNGTNSAHSLPEQIRTNDSNVMSSKNPPKNIYRIIAVCIWTFTCGASDAVPGALLPHMEKYYDINYTIVSLIWMANAAGFILVAALAHKIQPWFGKRYSICFGCMLSIIMYSVVSSGTVYPVTVLGFFFGGSGLAIVLAQSNIFLSRLDNLSKYLSFNHGSYGSGATLSPLVATALVNKGVAWHYTYLILLGLMTSNLILCWLAFAGADYDLKKFDESDDLIPESPQQDNVSQNSNYELESLQGQISQRENRRHNVSHKGEMALSLKSPTTWFLSFFFLFYQGSEVSLAGWIVTYLLDYRKGNPNAVGYVASGFWGGLTVGRLVLTRPLHRYLGSRRSVISCTFIAVVFVILTWVLPNVVAAGITVAAAGIFIGPSYSLMVTVCALVIPKRIQVVSMTIMTAFGSSGGAIFPFIVGLISQSVGTYVVLPVVIALNLGMLIFWVSLPNAERRRKQPTVKFNLWQRIW